MAQREADIGQDGGTEPRGGYGGLKSEAVFLCAKVDETFSHELTALYAEEYDRVIARSPILGYVDFDQVRQPVGEGAAELSRLSREYKRHMGKQSLIHSLDFSVAKGEAAYIVRPRLFIQWAPTLPEAPLGRSIDYMFAPGVEVRSEDDVNRLRKVGRAIQSVVNGGRRYYIDSVRVDTA